MKKYFLYTPGLREDLSKHVGKFSVRTLLTINQCSLAHCWRKRGANSYFENIPLYIHTFHFLKNYKHE